MNAASHLRHRWPQPLVLALVFIYSILFLVNPPNWFSSPLQNIVRNTQSLIIRAINQCVSTVRSLNSPRELANAIYLLIIAGLIPVIIARIAGRRLHDLGWRMPNKLALCYFIVALAISAPFLIWMVRSPTIAAPYLKQLSRLGFLAFSVFYLVNMFTEHLLLHGVVLGLVRPNGRWPEAVMVAPPTKGLLGILRWLGFGPPTLLPSREKGRDEGEDARLLHAKGPRLMTFTLWLGLAPGCLLPMFFSALLFGMVHLGKDTRELVLAFPGGLAQAYIAYRSNSWFTPFLIHLATASAALAMMMWMR